MRQRRALRHPIYDSSREDKKIVGMGKLCTICKKSVPFLFAATVSSLVYLLYFHFQFHFFFDLFNALLSKVGFSLGGRALSFALRGLGCSAGLALTVGFALRALLTGEEFAHMMIPFGEGTSGASSSESPATPASPSDSLIGHASDETNSDREVFYSPQSPSTSTSTPGAPNNGENEERYYIEPGSAAHEAMKESLIRIARGMLAEWEACGLIDGLAFNKTNEELAQALNLELVQTKGEMERLSKELLGLDWAKLETAPAGASYAGLSDLLKEHRRKTRLGE